MTESCQRASDELTFAFTLLGKRWTGVIIAVLMSGPAHFAALHRAIPGISERMLSDRLSELGEAGLVFREVLDGPPLRVRYRLTDTGLALRPAFSELVSWVRDHQQGHRATGPQALQPASTGGE